MAADIVPIRLGLTKGDLYTLWAPRWRDAGDEWEAFLGEGDALFAFESVADLAAFVRTNTDNDLADHPAWDKLVAANAHKLQPADDREYDIVGLPELVAEKPTEESVATVHRILVVVSSIGSVCELPAISKFFNGNPVLGTVGGGLEGFTGRSGRKRWAEIEAVIGRGWDGVVDAIDEIVTIPDEIDADAVKKAEAELEEDAPEEDADDLAVDTEDDADHDDNEDEEGAESARSVADTAVLGDDEDFWQKVGIDPVRIMTGSGTVYTLRCYLDDDPVFLGRNGRISVFSSERALARYLADEHDHDLSDLATYDDIRTAATDGSLRVEVSEENVYVLSGISDDIADGPDAVDHDQLELAVELLRDVSDYSEDKTVDETLAETKALGKFVAYVLGNDNARKPEAPYAQAVEQWDALERFVESRLRAE
ncbi:MAG: primosomal protein [Mycolicibacterium fortuitum]|uniref:protein export chaperone SatS n=1 Tax=Mycolicibacterium TaxID=1866885 RepID=UPI0007EDF9DE|nr:MULTISPECIES: primosomal protein [Mycolicibacterium]NOP95606.1 primosomal protein [Mycolicibacterium fortuitum]OBI56344.1 primosomal protein [Mycolicibacterium fortuitum]OBK13589.1 primosomal protein [Mycolicibacterium fortuitum]UBV16777.1 primosomal protein [Mycolicibacterium fortuitum]